MIISGLQKLTLLDYPGKTACIVFTYGCNFRCGFCHNALLVTERNEDTVSQEEFFDFLIKRKGILEAVSVTGGEPTLQKGLDEFLRKIKELDYAVKLDSNGTAPELLKKLIEQGLVDYVAMDIKNTPEKYELTASTRVDTDKILQSIELIKALAPDYEFRTTLTEQLHTEEDVRAICRLIGKDCKYFLQKFTDSGSLISQGHTPWADKRTEELCKELSAQGYNISAR